MFKESRRVLLYLFLLLPVYFLCSSIVELSNVKLVYLFDVKLFNFILSLNIVAVLLLVIESNGCTLRIPSHLWKAIAALFLLVTLGCAVYLGSNFLNLGKKAFAEWRELPLGLPLFFMLAYLCALYVPAYVLDSIILKSQWAPLEKLVFYPIISFAVLGSLAVISDLTGIQGLGRMVLLLVFSLGLLHLYSRTLLTKRAPGTREMLEVDVVNSITLLAVLTFSMFNLFVALGGGEASLRGDMHSDAHRIAFLSKYGLPAYFSSPSRGYPVAFSLS